MRTHTITGSFVSIIIEIKDYVLELNRNGFRVISVNINKIDDKYIGVVVYDNY